MTLQKEKIVFIISMIVVFSMVNTTIYKGADCYTDWYVSSDCWFCDDSTYNTTQVDSCTSAHPRQNGIKLCWLCKNTISSEATYYKRGFSDYNCLAYALGINSVQSWMWPSDWGQTGPTLEEFEKYISKWGYKCTMDLTEITGKEIIFVYAKDGYIKHFARKYTLDGKELEGVKAISKWGACSLYTNENAIDPYESNCIYGRLVTICYK